MATSEIIPGKLGNVEYSPIFKVPVFGATPARVVTSVPAQVLCRIPFR
jgi:hypothetical protein